MSFLPPIVKGAERLLVEIEQAVRGFPRYHKYTLGTDLRQQAMAVVRLCHRARRYLRYVDDFVLVHESRDQLAAWLPQIEAFLRDTLRLRLKPDIRLRPLGDGIDFLGYIVHPTHTRVRRRVVAHARASLANWERAHVADNALCATPADLRRVRSIWASYQGHLRHADSHRLRASIERRFPWLHAAAETPRRYHHRLEGRRLSISLHRSHAE